MPARHDLRNVAIVAHVDHGKTTLVDAMLWQSGVFRENQDVGERVMDSTDLEREKGITILAKNTAVRFGGVKLNIVDTPGHADFGGEVERALAMVDGVLLLVDAAEGPQPQTRFVLRKTLEARLPVILVINKVDRPDARVAEVVDEVYELFLDLDADHDQIEFPIVYANARDGLGLARRRPWRGRPPAAVRAARRAHPGPHLRGGPPAPGPGHQPRPLPLPRPPGPVPGPPGDDHQGPAGGLVPGRRHDRAGQGHRAVRHRGPRPGAGRGGRAGRDHRRGRPRRRHHRRDPGRRRRPPAPARHPHRRAQPVDDHRGQHRRPLAGQDGGTKLTARLVKSRLDTELVGNVSLRVFPTERPDTWEVQGRGELQLAVLVETMRREGFELTVGKPQVVTREIDGKLYEPVERMTVLVPEEHLGAVHPAPGHPQGPAASSWSTTAPAGSAWSTSCRPGASSGSAPSS